jgi:hypothetical protein
MIVESGIMLPNGKGHLSTALLKEVLKDGLLRRDVYGEALDLQGKQKCTQINEKHTI